MGTSSDYKTLKRTDGKYKSITLHFGFLVKTRWNENYSNKRNFY